MSYLRVNDACHVESAVTTGTDASRRSIKRRRPISRVTEQRLKPSSGKQEIIATHAPVAYPIKGHLKKHIIKTNHVTKSVHVIPNSKAL